MIMFLFRNYKAVIALSIALIGPMMLASWGFLLTTSKTNATIPLHEARILALEQTNYRMDERWKFVQKSLQVIQDREIEQLKKASQLSHAKRQGE